jgi:hypothetical protein
MKAKASSDSTRHAAGKGKVLSVRKRPRAAKTPSPRDPEAAKEREMKLGLTPDVKKELCSFLKREWQDKDFKPLDPVKVNHALQVFMAQAVCLMKLKPKKVKKLTGLSEPYQLKVQPHEDMAKDVQMSLVYAFKFANGLNLNPVHVLEWLMKKIASVFWS